MNQPNHKIIVLANYLVKPRAELTIDDVQQMLTGLKADARMLDSAVVSLKAKKHKLKDIQALKGDSTRIEGHLINALNWLEDKLEHTADETEREAVEKLSKLREDVAKRNDRVAKNISDDESACRYEDGLARPNFVQISSLLVSSFVAAAGVAKMYYHLKDSVSLHAGEIAVIAAGCVSFNRQIGKGFSVAGKALSGVHANVKSLERQSRFAAAAMHMMIITENKGNTDILPRLTDRHPAKLRTAVAFRM